MQDKNEFIQIVNDEEAQILYMRRFLTIQESKKLYIKLKKTANWKEIKFKLYDKEVTAHRENAMYGDSNLLNHWSDDPEDKIEMWTPELLELKNKIKDITGQEYNLVNINYYKDGEDYIGPHSDNENESMTETIIASVTLGAERDFIFHHKSTNKKISLILHCGSLLTMGGLCQKYYKHSLPKRPKIKHGRINLTFRYIKPKKI